MTLFNKLKKYTAFWFLVIVLGVLSFVWLCVYGDEYAALIISTAATGLIVSGIILLWGLAKYIASTHRND